MALNSIPSEVQSCQIYYCDEHRVDLQFHWGLLEPINKKENNGEHFQKKIEIHKSKNLSASNK